MRDRYKQAPGRRGIDERKENKEMEGGKKRHNVQRALYSPFSSRLISDSCIFFPFLFLLFSHFRTEEGREREREMNNNEETGKRRKDTRYIDFHCHPQLCPDCSLLGEDRILLANSYSHDCFEKIRKLSADHPHSIIPFYGIHPWAVGTLEEGELEDIARETNELLEGDPCACVGEIGLDYLKTRDTEGRKKQREVLKLFLALAMKHKRAVSIHVVPSKGEVWKDLLSCFSLIDNTIPVILHLYGGRQGMLSKQFSDYLVFPSVRVTGEEEKGVSPRVQSLLSLPNCLIESDCDGDRGKTLEWSEGVIEEGYKAKEEHSAKKIDGNITAVSDAHMLLNEICGKWVERETVM